MDKTEFMESRAARVLLDLAANAEFMAMVDSNPAAAKEQAYLFLGPEAHYVFQAKEALREHGLMVQATPAQPDLTPEQLESGEIPLDAPSDEELEAKAHRESALTDEGYAQLLAARVWLAQNSQPQE